MAEFVPPVPEPAPPAPEPAPPASARGSPPSDKERMEAIERLAKKHPNLWRRVKAGAIIGLVGGMMYAGYKENAIDAWLQSKRTQQEVARVLTEERDTRTAMQKLFKKVPAPKPIPVGQGWKTKRDASGRLVEIGKDRILRGYPGNLRLRPTIPVGSQAAKSGAAGAAIGSAAALALALRKRQKIRRQLETVKAGGPIPESAGARFRRISKGMFKGKPHSPRRP